MMQGPVQSDQQYRFGVFTVSPESRELLRQGRLVKIQDQPFELLLVFLDHPGQILDRAFLREQLWPDNTFVDFAQSLSTAVTKLRQVLGDDATNPRFIETVPRHGYRFIAPVTRPARDTGPPVVVTPQPLEEPPAPPPATRSLRPVVWASAAAVLLLLAGALFFWWRHRQAVFVLAPKDTIVLADFENTTGESIFNDTLHQALMVEMSQSPVLRILPDRQAALIYRQMGHSADERMTGRAALALCRRVGSKVVLQGSISSLGTSYLIDLAGIRCDTGKPIANEQMQVARSEEVIEALGKTAAKLRAQLGESLPSIQKYNAPLEQATTPSLDALKMYGVALSTWDAKGDVASLPYFQQAVAIDPEFAMAYSGLATVYNNLGQADLARANTIKAFNLRARVTETERASIEARYYLYVTEEIEKAAQTYDVLAREYPDAAGSINHLATVEIKLGNDQEAVEHLRKALALDPTRAATYVNLALALMRLNRMQEVAPVLDAADQRGLRIAFWFQTHYWLAFLNGNQQEMDRWVAAVAPNAEAKPALLSAEADTQAWHGRYREAFATSLAAAKLMQSANDKESAAACLARAAIREAEAGDAGRARSSLAQARALSTDRPIQLATALVDAQLGDTTQAIAITRELDQRYPNGTFIQNFWLPVIRAKSELRRGNGKQAVALLSTARNLDPILAIDFGFSSLFSSYVRGQAYLASGDGDRAAAEFRKLIEQRGLVVNSPFGSLAYLGLARSLRLAGRRDEAAQAYRDFFARWSDPDPDLPLVRQARAEQAAAHSH
jgi:DNA-binding winged helix-turn-helix (wHTH) protein/tetratricopeptide (TPR) repeat protein